MRVHVRVHERACVHMRACVHVVRALCVCVCARHQLGWLAATLNSCTCVRSCVCVVCVCVCVCVWRQLGWLEATLNASTAAWLVVAGHYPVYSGGEHGDTPELLQQAPREGGGRGGGVGALQHHHPTQTDKQTHAREGVGVKWGVGVGMGWGSGGGGWGEEGGGRGADGGRTGGSWDEAGPDVLRFGFVKAVCDGGGGGVVV